MTHTKAVTAVTLVALLFAALASWGVYSYLKGETEKSKAAAGTGIVVAAADISVGTRLNRTHLKMVSWPKEAIPQNSFRDPKLLDGRVAVRQVSANDAVTEQKLMPKEGSAGAAGVMTYMIPPGHRAVTVAVNEVAGVAGFVAPNNRIDVVLTTPVPANREQNISKIILQNVTVLATGQITEQKEGKPVLVPTVTLDLLPQDAEKLVLAASKGSLQLLLRNVIDIDPVDARGATIAHVLAGQGTQATRASVRQPVSAKVRQTTAAPSRKTALASVSPEKEQAAPAKISRHSVTVLDGSVRTTKEFLFQ